MTSFGASPNESRGAGAARIVVVDDVRANVDLLDRLLSKTCSARIEGFTDPLAALEVCSTDPPDLILLDLHMPVLDGVGFLSRLRNVMGSRQFVPVIVLTADIGVEARHRVLEAGAKDFLTKPFDTAEVVLRVRNTLESTYAYTLLRRHAESLQRAVDVQRAQDDEENEQRALQVDRIEAAMQPHGMTIVYQPIVCLATERIVGAEALARFAGPPQRPPNEWFDEAAEIGSLASLEIQAIRRALDGIAEFPDGTFLSLNVSPSTAMAAELHEALRGVPADRIVLELTEHNRVESYGPLNARLRPFIEAGGRIAIDDAGAGYAGLQHLVQLRPHVIKLDAGLTRGIDVDLPRRALVMSLVSFAADIDATIIAEGIETAAELQALQDFGIRWGQGFHLARPGPLPLGLDPKATPAAAPSMAPRAMLPEQRVGAQLVRD